MKNYDELTRRLLQRRNQYVAEQKKKRRYVTRVLASVGCCALVGVIGVGLLYSDAFTETPPVTPITTTTASTSATAHSGTEGSVTHQTILTTPTETTHTTVTVTSTDTTALSTTSQMAPTTSQTTPTTSQTAPTTSRTEPTSSQTTSTQTTSTTQTTVTVPSNEDPVDPLPEWPVLWIIYDMNANYANGEVPIYFKLEGFEEVPFDWVKETSYTAYGFSVVGDITVERDAETGAIIYRMVLAYDGVTSKPSFFFSVVTADGMKQTDGLYGYPAPHGFFASCSYDSAFSSSVYYLVETGVITHDEYQSIMEKYWSQFGFEFSIVVDDNLH